MADVTPTKETVTADIAKYVSGQGNQAGCEGLGQILKDILSLIPDAE